MRSSFLLVCLSILSGCASLSAEQSAQNRFFGRLSALCGKTFEGHVSSPATEADAAFASKRLVMDVRDCSADTIRIPFHVGEDRSRTWVVSRTPRGLRLKHDHRHEDGSEDRLTQYGGDTVAAGSATRQEFPVDASSRDLFARQSLPQSTTNVWALEVEPGRAAAYELRRSGRFFRVEFDLAHPVAAVPPPWGSR